MFEKTLTKGAKDNLAILGKSGLLKDAYLAGGTAAALWLGHRISVDFDFFTPKEFNPRQVATHLLELGRFEEDQADKGTVLGRFKGVKFSLFAYKYPLIAPTKNYLSLNIADLRDLGVMKIDAISNRGARRDFIDLYFICQAGYKIDELLSLYDKKYATLGPNLIHIQKSLVFFNDAEVDDMPEMFKKVKWVDVKIYFEKQVRKLTKGG